MRPFSGKLASVSSNVRGNPARWGWQVSAMAITVPDVNSCVRNATHPGGCGSGQKAITLNGGSLNIAEKGWWWVW